MWTNFFDKIYVINLPKREDRLIDITTQFEEYEIPFTRFSAKEDENGARGLRDTMVKLFEEAIDSEFDNILVFEDDALFVQPKIIVDETMQAVIRQLPENYLMCFLGGQPTGGFDSFHSANLMPVKKYFSTHAVMYSKQCIKEILTLKMDYPIDNWFVSDIQPMGRCYAINPLLCTQKEGYSDIGKHHINWNLFIEPKHQQEMNKLYNK